MAIRYLKMDAATGAMMAFYLLAGNALADKRPKVIDKTTCASGRLDLSMKTEEQTLVFQCKKPFPHLDPSETEYVFKEESQQPSAKVLLDTVIVKATLTAAANSGTHYTLRVPDRPTTDTKLVYVCRKQAVDKKANRSLAIKSEPTAKKSPRNCTVTITVVGKPADTEDDRSPPPGPEDQNDDKTSSGKTYTCADGHDIKITVSKQNTNLKLKCPSSLIFEPTKAAEVFDDEDGECKTAKALSVLVPEVERRDESGVLTLKIPRLPAGSKNTALCYRCRTASAGSQRETEQGCAFRISVVAAESADSRFPGLETIGAFFLYIIGAVFGAVTAVSPC
ncbi:SAG-related sequence [Besnoitia besnoiti]|uniref:SAG-related sequence n=1 Tax=Besnoitia besnoiti TaxID=94643 RepID=A0A2A9MHD4_BESBE|nr:SAG-related sequence [Besnoitia besnoiti]PFH37375.1 SAG-related sequence [Besnoitia besnoiti]